jgi:hypothetical protein
VLSQESPVRDGPLEAEAPAAALSAAAWAASASGRILAAVRAALHSVVWESVPWSPAQWVKGSWKTLAPLAGPGALAAGAWAVPTAPPEQSRGRD